MRYLILAICFALSLVLYISTVSSYSGNTSTTAIENTMTEDFSDSITTLD